MSCWRPFGAKLQRAVEGTALESSPVRTLRQPTDRSKTRAPAPDRTGGVSLVAVDRAVRAALEEDLGPELSVGDLTTDHALSSDVLARGALIAKADCTLAGLAVFRRVFELLGESSRSPSAVSFTDESEDGAEVVHGDVVLRLAGPAAILLRGERVALNFLQRMSGIATRTRRFVDLAAGRARILDTRKTTPGLRVFEKYAVRCGGGENHRFGLFDEVMVKDNHVDASGEDLGTLLERLRERHGDVRMTAEARDETEALAAIAGGADVVMLDNMTPDALRLLCPRLRRAASSRARPLEIEASGGVDLSNVAEIASTGVDRISVGRLTHSSPALDLSLALEIVR